MIWASKYGFLTPGFDGFSPQNSPKWAKSLSVKFLYQTAFILAFIRTQITQIIKINADYILGLLIAV